MRKVWFVTGANRGLGNAITRAALAAGDQVVATARDTAGLAELTELGATALRMDVTERGGVQAAVGAAIDGHGRIDVLVNNAGHGLIGALEELSEEQIDAVLDTNVRGVLHVTRAVLPHMRARRSGHIVQLSSVGGVVANPGHGIYATSKFALEGMSEALAGELAPFGIRVTLVEPGPFRTDFAGTSMRFATPIDDYAASPAGQLRERFPAQDGKQPNDPDRAAEFIVRLAGTDSAPLRLPLGPEAVDRIREKLRAQLAELEQWAEVAADTRFAGR
ncbi:oxidoreductase [Sciscionella marina]|uniref:oxidoreductase n=1 Tax=Sciscionella marina TaxID=508770 RepID=UPI0003615744|nr:oxidoreductase [Sciscionella marina]